MAVIHSQYREEGKVAVDEQACKQCGACVRYCASQCLRMENQRVVQVESGFGCIGCGHCMMVCPHDAIRVSGRGIGGVLPMPSASEIASADHLTGLMQSRRSVRFYKDQSVEPELIERVVRMASTAPMGIPPWDVGVASVIGKEQVHRVAGEVIKGYEGMLKIFKPWLLALMRPILGKAKHEQFRDFVLPLAKGYVREWASGRDVVFYGAPVMLVFHHSPYADAADAMIACTYAMLAAESLGLGNCMIGGAAPIMQRNKTLCESLGIPSGNKPVVALIMGHADVKFHKTIQRRFSVEKVVGSVQ